MRLILAGLAGLAVGFTVLVAGIVRVAQILGEDE